jgi:hypothetical protein
MKPIYGEISGSELRSFTLETRFESTGFFKVINLKESSIFREASGKSPCLSRWFLLESIHSANVSNIEIKKFFIGKTIGKISSAANLLQRFTILFASARKNKFYPRRKAKYEFRSGMAGYAGTAPNGHV